MTPEMLATLTEQVAELVQTYSNNYLQFQRATYNETQVRVDFVNRFFKESLTLHSIIQSSDIMKER